MEEQPHRLGVTNVASTEWLSLQQVSFVDCGGRKRQWDRCVRRTPRADDHRTSTPNASSPVSGFDTDVDCSAVLAIASRREDGISKPVGIFFVQQYRPALDAFTIELPAGLLDKNETAGECAVRELREETGYTASEVLFVSPKVSLSPGIGTECVYIVAANVDLGSVENQIPQQCLDDDEKGLKVLMLPAGRELLPALQNLAREGNVIFDGVYCFALGLAMGGDDPVDALKRLPSVHHS